VSGRRWAIQFVCLAGMVIMTAGASAERQFAVYSSGISVPLHAADGASAPETLQGISSSQWCFEAIGRQFTEPAHALSPPGNSADTCSPALLPAVPAAISLTLCGFLCVSFVRDRRAWLAVACALLWPGRAGIRAVPQLGHKLRCKAGNCEFESCVAGRFIPTGRQPRGCSLHRAAPTPRRNTTPQPVQHTRYIVQLAIPAKAGIQIWQSKIAALCNR